MPPIQQITEHLKAKMALHRGTPEQIEQARRKAMQRNLDCRIDCPLCGGLGFVKDENGSLVPCPNISSQALFQGDRYGLDRNERGLTWDQIARMKWLEPAIAAVQETLARGAGFVYLWGPPGVAKTLILKTAVAMSLEAHRTAAYTYMAEIIDDMRAAFDASDPSAESQRRLDWWAGLPLLAIDEFDRLRATEYAAERRFLLMDRRYEGALRSASAMRGVGAPRIAAVTLMAANEDPAQLDGYLYDRIRDGRFRVVHIEGKSMRPAMEW